MDKVTINFQFKGSVMPSMPSFIWHPRVIYFFRGATEILCWKLKIDKVHINPCLAGNNKSIRVNLTPFSLTEYFVRNLLDNKLCGLFDGITGFLCHVLFCLCSGAFKGSSRIHVRWGRRFLREQLFLDLSSGGKLILLWPVRGAAYFIPSRRGGNVLPLKMSKTFLFRFRGFNSIFGF